MYYKLINFYNNYVKNLCLIDNTKIKKKIFDRYTVCYPPSRKSVKKEKKL